MTAGRKAQAPAPAPAPLAPAEGIVIRTEVEVRMKPDLATIQAGVVSELKRLAAPSSVDSIPSSAMQEDHVSMGWSAARKLRRGVDGLRTVLAIELLTAARALDLSAPLRPAPVTAAVRDLVRTRVAGPGPDRHLAPEIAAVEELIASGAVLTAVEES